MHLCVFCFDVFVCVSLRVTLTGGRARAGGGLVSFPVTMVSRPAQPTGPCVAGLCNLRWKPVKPVWVQAAIQLSFPFLLFYLFIYLFLMKVLIMFFASLQLPSRQSRLTIHCTKRPNEVRPIWPCPGTLRPTALPDVWCQWRSDPCFPRWTGNLSWLRECIENKVGVNGLDKAGNTALYWACHGGHKGNGCGCETGSAFPADVRAVLFCQMWWSCC